MGESNLKDHSDTVKEVTEDCQYVQIDLQNGKTDVLSFQTDRSFI